MRCFTSPLNTLTSYRYVVVFSFYQGKLLFSRHRNRTTWETQGGHIENGETPIDAAKRELYEESGALEYEISPLFDYHAEDEHSGSNGVVFLAQIQVLDALPDYEMAEIGFFDVLPEQLTYPGITPVLYQKFQEITKGNPKMDIRSYYQDPNEKPLDRIPADGGFAGIFRTIGCIGDSLSSGEFESLDENGNRGYHDMFEYSWGQYLGRLVGSTVRNFSRGGMTAIEYMQSFAEANDYWNEDKLCQCYIIALGVNDLFGRKMPIGSVSDICADDYTKNNPETFAGWYAQIVQRLKTMQPKARFFFMTMLHEGDEAHDRIVDEHAALLHDMAAFFDYSYVIDFAKYGPVYDAEFKRNFYLGGHLNAAGYLLTSRMTAAYMDYIIRNHPDDFTQVGFIGQPFHNHGAKW